MSIFKNFLMKQMVKRQMKGMPEGEQTRVLKMVEENPDLFTKIAKEIQVKIKGGKGQMEASMEVMKKYQSELRNAMGK
ncbi:MAG: hypothetical protein Q7R78_01025 [bacterium]|nr:hypothetical protein [bacterium]